MNDSLVLIANPGSASRKYALFKGISELAKLHFEWEGDRIHYTFTTEKEHRGDFTELKSLEETTSEVLPILQKYSRIMQNESIAFIALRIVAPGSYFLIDRLIDDDYLAKLRQAKEHAPLHVEATLAELSRLRQEFPSLPIYGISDSAFHGTKPDYAWNYGISLELADMLDIKRFGYHGLSVASALRQFRAPAKTIVCHLGSGASVTAVLNNKSIDTTMGYSPLEGLIMSTRSGSLDASIIPVLKKAKNLNDSGLEEYLNKQSGLLGLGGSNDIRRLLEREENGDTRAKLALDTYIYIVQKGIGQMATALNGLDAIVFTGTVGERSALIRSRIMTHLTHLDFALDHEANNHAVDLKTVVSIYSISSKPIIVISAQEEQEIVQHMFTLIAV